MFDNELCNAFGVSEFNGVFTQGSLRPFGKLRAGRLRQPWATVTNRVAVKTWWSTPPTKALQLSGRQRGRLAFCFRRAYTACNPADSFR